MGHQPFKTWLFSEEPLEPDQEAALQAHLDSCESCRSLSADWVEVRNLFTRSGPVGPAPSFSTRWQARLAVQESKARREIEQEVNILFIGVTSGIALILLMAILAAGIIIFDSPSQYLMTGLYSLGNIINSLNAFENILVVMAQVLPGVVPASGWIVFILLVSLLGVAWTYVLQKILVPRRTTS